MPRLVVAVPFAFAVALPAFALVGCVSNPPPPRVVREHVTRHYVVVVQEEDPRAPEEERKDHLVTRPVASGPLGKATEHETAFAMRDPRFAVSVVWRGECLDVSVARHGLPPFDDFDVHGCVEPRGASMTVATVSGASGAPIEVQLWLFG